MCFIYDYFTVVLTFGNYLQANIPSYFLLVWGGQKPKEKQNGHSWRSGFGFKNFKKYGYLQCFRRFSAVKTRWNANFEFWLHDEAHKILQVPVFGALHCSETHVMHHGVTGEPYRIIHAKDDSILEAEEVYLRHVCHSSFLHTVLSLINWNRKTEERWGRSDHIDSSSQVKLPKRKGIPKNSEQCVC